ELRFAKKKEGATDALITELSAIRDQLLATESEVNRWHSRIAPSHHASVRNLQHYLALRQFDIRPLQERLAELGISSLGRAESHVLDALNSVLRLLHLIEARPWPPEEVKGPAPNHQEGRRLLKQNAQELLGLTPRNRQVRI